MYAPFISPPGRDMANMPPFLPDDSAETSPTVNQIYGSLMLAIGTGVLGNVLLRLLLDLDGHVAKSLLVSDFLAVMAAISFFTCGLLVFYRGVMWSSILLFCGVVLVVFSKLMG